MTQKPEVCYEMLIPAYVTDMDARDATLLGKELMRHPRVVTQEDLMMSAKERCIYTARVKHDDPSKRGRIVGMASMVIIYRPISGPKALIEDVVVLKCFQGKSKGRTLMERLIALAKTKEWEVHAAWLTSSKSPRENSGAQNV